MMRRVLTELRDVEAMCDAPTRRAYRKAIASQAVDIVRLRSLRAADAAMQGQTCTFFIDGDRVALEGEHFGLAREIYGRRAYLTGSPAIHQGDTVIDLGANAGVFSILAARLGARVIAVEAQSKELARLERTLELNPSYAGAVTPVHGLVGAGAGLLSEWSATDFGGDRPPKITIDELLTRFGLERIDFLKIDIEGAEFALITDGADWLDATRSIAMELHPSFGDSTKLIDVLRRRSFRVDLRGGDGRQIDSVSGQSGYLYATEWPVSGDGHLAVGRAHG